ncbi:MAG: reductive dehalogenase [Chloroflexi bacterium]|nr:reductive dehalogenase [Chloroflexota bacterium]
MSKQADHADSLAGKRQLGPYAMEKLKRVAKPTTRVTDSIQRSDAREHGFARASRGDFGKLGTKGSAFTRATKDPLFPLFGAMLMGLPPVDNGVTLKVPPRMLYVRQSSKTALMSSLAATETHPMLEVAPQKASIPDDPAVMSRHIKSMGYFLGADVMGVCELPQWALYSYTEEGEPVKNNHKYAICIVVDQDHRTLSGSTGHDWIAGSPPQKSYLFSAFIATLIAGYIRKLGYEARVQHAQNYQVLITPLLLLSGIGELCRSGIVLNPFLGLRFKAAAVTTDLPLGPDSPVDFGLQDFCDKCKKCARECPPKALSMGDKIMRNGYETWDVNYERCTRYRLGNPNGVGCGRCIRVCPWNKPQGRIHDLVRWTVAHTTLANQLIIKMDDVFGYGKPDIRDKWQLDL